MQIKKMLLMLALVVSSMAFSQRDVRVNVNQYFRSGETLGVVRTLGIRHLINQGITPSSIIVQADAMGPRRHGSASVALLINGMSLGINQQIDRTGYVVLPVYANQRNIRTIQLQFLGSEIYVRSLEAQFQGRHGNGQRVMAQINQNYHGQNTLRVKGLLNRFGNGTIQGKSIQRVILKASSARGRGQATLYINGEMVSTQILSTFGDRVVFDLPYHMQHNIVVGQNGRGPVGGRLYPIRTIQIDLRGNIFVEKVGVKVQQGRVITRPGRPGRPLPPVPPRRPRRPGRGPRNI